MTTHAPTALDGLIGQFEAHSGALPSVAAAPTYAPAPVAALPPSPVSAAVAPVAMTVAAPEVVAPVASPLPAPVPPAIANPPEAVQVIQTHTAPEIAGMPEPAAPVAPPPAPTALPPAIAAAQAEKPKRRTAALVQKELDDALAQIFQLKAIAAQAAPAAAAPAVDVSAYTARIAELEGGLTAAMNQPAVTTVEGLCDALIAKGFQPNLARIIK